jgi:hypothetical protein
LFLRRFFGGRFGFFFDGRFHRFRDFRDGINPVADFQGSGLDVRRRVLAEFLAGDAEVRCTAIRALGGEDGAGLHLP